MDWIIGMQKAIDYIEEHITEEIDYEMVAQQSFSSSFHFSGYSASFAGIPWGSIFAAAAYPWRERSWLWGR